MTEKIEKTIIVGSGVSYSLAGIPLQNAFWETIEKYIEDQGFGLFHNSLMDRLRETTKRYYAAYDIAMDIEKRFSWLHELTYTSSVNEIKQIALTLTRFRSIIAKFLSDRSKIPKIPEKHKIKNRKTAIILLNFDEIFEKNILENYRYEGFLGCVA